MKKVQNTRMIILIMAMACFILLLSSSAFGDQKAVVVTAAADYSSGAHSVIDVNPVGGPRTASNNLLPTISDLAVAAHGQYFFRMERYESDSITKFHINAPTTPVSQFSTLDDGATGSNNPHDLIFVSETKAYLLLYESAKAWIVNPSATTQAEFKTGELDLSPYADSDGIPEMHTGALVGNKLFIALQRLDRDNSWAASNTSYLAVFDTTTDTEIDTGTANDDGVSGIALPVRNPATLEYLAESNLVYVQGSGIFESSWSGTPADYSGGICAVDPNTYVVSMILDDGDDESHPYGNFSGIALVSPTKGYFIGYAGWGDNSLYSFNPTTGEVYGAVAGLQNINMVAMTRAAYVDENKMVWVCNATDARVDILNPATDTIDESVSTELNPQAIAFVTIDTEVPPSGPPTAAPVVGATTAGEMFTVSWEAVAGAESYVLWFVKDNDFTNIYQLNIGTLTSLSVPAWSGYSITLAITATNAAGSGPFSNIVTLP